MKLSGVLAFATVLLCSCRVWAADATRPIDYRERNEPFAPGPSVDLGKQKPTTNQQVQDRRVDKTPFEKTPAPIAGQKSAVQTKETREKQLLHKDSYRPEGETQPTSAMNHRTATIATQKDTAKPPMVAKYQNSLVTASATNMARFPAVDAATSAKINRFVFRKNPPETGAALEGATITPAGGGPKASK
jgi:hypothetical protein